MCLRNRAGKRLDGLTLESAFRVWRLRVARARRTGTAFDRVVLTSTDYHSLGLRLRLREGLADEGGPRRTSTDRFHSSSSIWLIEPDVAVRTQLAT